MPKTSSSPAAYPHLLTSQQEDLQAEYSDLLQSILGHESLLPSSDLSILHGKKSWLLNLDAVILSDTGNIYDVLFIACRAALFDTRVPRTRAVAYQTTTMATKTSDRIDVEMEMGDDNFKAALRSRKQGRAADFELEDTWDAGVPLTEREKWPICITLNVVSSPQSQSSHHAKCYLSKLINSKLICDNFITKLPSVHVVDATPGEERAIPLKLLLFFAFPGDGPMLQGTRMIGSGQLSSPYLKRLIKVRNARLCVYPFTCSPSNRFLSHRRKAKVTLYSLSRLLTAN
jgi:exosome complex component RRP42